MVTYTDTHTFDYVTALLNADRAQAIEATNWTGESSHQVDAHYDTMLATLTAKFADEDVDFDEDVIDFYAQSTTGIPMF